MAPRSGVRKKGTVRKKTLEGHTQEKLVTEVHIHLNDSKPVTLTVKVSQHILTPNCIWQVYPSATTKYHTSVKIIVFVMT